MIHEWISIEYAFAHFYNIKIVVSESHSIPQQSAISWLSSLSISVLTYNVLDGVQLSSTVICVNKNLRPSQLSLLLSIHNVVLMDGILMPDWCALRILHIALACLIQIMNLITSHILHYFTLQISISFLLVLLLLRGSRNFKRLGVLLLIKLIHLILVFRAVTSSLFLVASLVIHLELVILLLQSSAIVIEYYLFIGIFVCKLRLLLILTSWLLLNT